jgi:cell division protein FtsA
MSEALEAGESQLGVPLEEAVVGIGGTHFTVLKAKGVVGVSRPDGDIRHEDVERALESARSMANPANYEILHVLSHDFTVDGQGGVKDPVGMHGIRLEADTHLILGLAGNVRNMTKGVFRTGLDIASLVFGPLASAEAVTNARERELGVAVVNIGASTTSILVFEEGQLIHANVLPVGSEHITSDIAIGLRTSLSVAEEVKLRSGTARPEDFSKVDLVEVVEFGGDPEENVSLKYVAEIIEARAEEICEKVEEELERIDRSGLLPAGIVLTGGGAKLPGMADVAKRMLRLPASVGAATHLATPMPEFVHDPAFSTAAGLVAWGFEEIRGEHERPKQRFLAKGSGAMSGISEQIKKVFRSFIP